MTEPNDDILRDWLLGRLPSAEAQALELRLLEDDDFGQRLRVAENDLIDDLARERLSGDARARAEAYFKATPGDRARLRIARALAAWVGTAQTRREPHRRSVVTQTVHGRRIRHNAFATRLLAGACAIIVAGVGIRAWMTRESPTAQTEAPFTITLTGGGQRGGSSIDVAIPRDATRIRVQAEIEASDGATCTLMIDDAGVVAFAANHLVARSAGPYRFVETTVPASALAPGQHRLRVMAEQAQGVSSSWLLTTQSK